MIGLNDPDKDLAIGQVLGASAGTAFRRLAKRMSRSFDPAEADIDEACGCCDGYPEEWGIWHIGDSWRVSARFHYGPSSTCSQQTTDRAIATAVPKGMFSGGSLKRNWDEVRREAADILKSDLGSVRHIFVSPHQDLAVALTTKGLAVLTIEDSHIKSLLKLQPFSSPCLPVMEQWATGRFVAKWGAAIEEQAPEVELQ